MRDPWLSALPSRGVWPYRVGVMLAKRFRDTSSSKRNKKFLSRFLIFERPRGMSLPAGLLSVNFSDAPVA